ncbi:hypothetical protein HPB52_007860 [Rhipicephalus sanguineus]|uniref:MADF domain-containing protein n=1 Tax=Rhipicephalus sanguineus TaxID=34632 RepID=A0A9D4T1S6_RHISA|nr:hypothetical protein HPB52_007860 [Rhipicephalus sanguineus]
MYFNSCRALQERIQRPRVAVVTCILTPHRVIGETMKECSFLHCDVAGRPYLLEDFREPLQELGVLKDVTGIGPFQMTHVGLIKLRTRKAKDALVNAGGLELKGRFCAVIDPVQQDTTLKVHWVPFHVTGEALTKAFDHYGEVKEIRQEEWKVRGFEQAESLVALCSSLFPEELQFVFVVDVKDILDETAECQEQGSTDAEKVVTPSASTQDATTGRKQKNRRSKEEEKTAPAPTVLDNGRDAQNEYFNVEPETPYETPDKMATQEPATPAKRCRRDATTVDVTVEETMVDSAQRLEPQWMEVRKGNTAQREGHRRSPEKGRRRSDQRDRRRGCPFKLSCQRRRSIQTSAFLGATMATAEYSAELLINAIKMYPFIYDKRHPCFKDRTKKDQAWAEI